MHCGTCGAELIPDARFCTRCGAKVELGSLLGVGTDLPPIPTHPPAPRPDRAPRTSRVADTPQPQPQRQAESPAAERHAPSGTFSPGRVAAMVATFIVLTILGTFALSQLFGPDVPDPAATSESTGAGQGPASPGESSPAPSPPESSEAAPSPTATVPEGARRCSKSGTDAVATAYSGNKDTSCAFTNAVRKAYREAGAATDPKPFRTYSTVTKRWYVVTCDTATPVRCQSADGAAVTFLGP